MWGKTSVFALAALCVTAQSDNPVRAKGAEFILDESILRQLQFTQKQTNPFVDEGHLVSPNLDVVVTPSFQNNVQGSSVVRLNVSVSGTTSTNETQSVGRRRQVNVNVTNQMSGRFQQDLYVDGRGLSAAGTSGNMNASPTITTSNNFRLLNNLVNRVAFKKANQMVSSKLPGKLAEADNKVKGTLGGAAEQAANSLAHLLQGAEQMLPASAPAGVSLAFDSRGGEKGRLLSQVIDTNPNRKPQPKLDLLAQASTRAWIHQDLLNTLMNHQLAGRELKFSEFQKEVCAKLGSKMLDFCNANLPDDVKATAVQFNSPKALEFFFEKGKIRFRLHAIYKQRDLAAVKASTAAGLGAPESKGVKMATAPYTVDVTYKVNSSGGELESLKVSAVEKPVAPPPRTAQVAGAGPQAPAEPKKPEGWHLPNTLNRLREVVTDGTVDLVTRNELEKNFKQLFKPKVSIMPVSLPLKVHSGDGLQPTMSEAGTIFPLEVKAEEGWLAVAGTMCSDAYAALGVTPLLSQSIPAGPNRLYLSAVAPYSPAWQSGLRPGDRIESFGVPGERPTTLIQSANEFIAFTQNRATGPSAEARTVELSGTDASGKKFTRTIALCPKGYDHKAKARENFSKLTLN